MNVAPVTDVLHNATSINTIKPVWNVCNPFFTKLAVPFELLSFYFVIRRAFLFVSLATTPSYIIMGFFFKNRFPNRSFFSLNNFEIA